MSTQGGDATHDCFGVLASATFPLFPNHKSAHDLPHPSRVCIEVHLTVLLLRLVELCGGCQLVVLPGLVVVIQPGERGLCRRLGRSWDITYDLGVIETVFRRTTPRL